MSPLLQMFTNQTFADTGWTENLPVLGAQKAALREPRGLAPALAAP